MDNQLKKIEEAIKLLNSYDYKVVKTSELDYCKLVCKCGNEYNYIPTECQNCGTIFVDI